MKKQFLLIFSIACCCIANAQTAKGFNTAIGKTFVFNKISNIDVFTDFKEYGNALVTGPNDEKDVMTEISDGTRTVVLFSKYSPQGNKIRAVLDLGKIEKGNKIMIRECRVNGQNDNLIVALVSTKGAGAYFTNVRKAWRADKKTDRFVAIPVKGVDCASDEFGL